MSVLISTGMPAALSKREVLEQHVEQMIALLDMLDEDLDLEPEETDQDSADQNEVDCDLQEGDGDADGEPNLGSVETLVFSLAYGIASGSGSQLAWSGSGTDDREGDAGDEREADADEEHWRQPARMDALWEGVEPAR